MNNINFSVLDLGLGAAPFGDWNVGLFVLPTVKLTLVFIGLLSRISFSIAAAAENYCMLKQPEMMRRGRGRHNLKAASKFDFVPNS